MSFITIQDNIIENYSSSLLDRLENGGIEEMLKYAIKQKLIVIPDGIDIVVTKLTSSQRATYSIYYTHALWGSTRLFAGYGKHQEYLLHSSLKKDKGYYILRRIVDSVNSSLSSLTTSADMILAQFSSDASVLRYLASSGDEALLNVVKNNPNVNDEILVMISLRQTSV